MYRKRTDPNHKMVSELFRKGGWEVKTTHHHPSFVDMLVGRDGIGIFIEVKRPGEKPTPSQRKLHKFLTETCGWRVEVVSTKEDVLEILRGY